jgi:hypothetical protein
MKDETRVVEGDCFLSEKPTFTALSEATHIRKMP